MQVETLADVLGLLLKSQYLEAERMARKVVSPASMRDQGLLQWQTYTARRIGKLLVASAEDLGRVSASSRLYYDQLRKLTLKWRLSLSGEAILCDFGNRSIGSSYFDKVAILGTKPVLIMPFPCFAFFLFA